MRRAGMARFTRCGGNGLSLRDEQPAQVVKEGQSTADENTKIWLHRQDRRRARRLTPSTATYWRA